MTTAIIRRPEVCKITGLSYSTIFRMERAGRFPSRRRLGHHSVGWVLAEVLAWIDARQAVVPTAPTAEAA